MKKFPIHLNSEFGGCNDASQLQIKCCYRAANEFWKEIMINEPSAILQPKTVMTKQSMLNKDLQNALKKRITYYCDKCDVPKNLETINSNDMNVNLIDFFLSQLGGWKKCFNCNKMYCHEHQDKHDPKLCEQCSSCLIYE